jgi:hypothetical protein
MKEEIKEIVFHLVRTFAFATRTMRRSTILEEGDNYFTVKLGRRTYKITVAKL